MIKKTKNVRLKKPLLIACWPGMGEVSIQIGIFLKNSLKFTPFAAIENSGLFSPAAITVKHGLIGIPKIQEGVFYYSKTKEKDIVLFLSDLQPPIEKAYFMARKIIDFAANLRISTVMTFAALPSPIEHTSLPKVWSAGTSNKILAKLAQYKTNILSEGQISGLNGLLTGAALEKKIEAACLLAEVPLYTIHIENPGASKAILQVLSRYLGMRFKLDKFDEKSYYINQEIDRLIGYLKGEKSPQEKPLNEQDIERIKKELSALTKIPSSVERKIEELFKKSREDIKHSQQLKKLLDDWGIYKKYEDRFLDLFRKKHL